MKKIAQGAYRRRERQLEAAQRQAESTKNFLCCLGFDALACGIPRDRIIGKADPESLFPYHYVPADYINTRLVQSPEGYYFNAPAVKRAIGANDDPAISDEEREQKVRAALMELGWDDVVFVN